MKLNEHKIIKYCLTLFLFLFTLLFFLDMNHYPVVVEISDLDVGFNNKKVSVFGEVTKINQVNDMVFILIEDEFGNEIDAILFGVDEILQENNSQKSNLNIEKYEKYYFVGRITLYNGKNELIVDEVKKDL